MLCSCGFSFRLVVDWNLRASSPIFAKEMETREGSRDGKYRQNDRWMVPGQAKN